MSVPESDHPLLMLTTLPSREAAQALAREAVQRHLAACAQIQAIDSIYSWQGKVCEDPEWRLLLKTTQGRQAALAALLAELHPYELPALLSLTVQWTEPGFAAWIAESVAAPQA
ncbi:MAG TPA: divalent-cation tolerance protein CutA [Burkholderiaceae bacterium]|nr:divalent-cation tolerance protein CutA [Burkholderiaceae bacterium]